MKDLFRLPDDWVEHVLAFLGITFPAWGLLLVTFSAWTLHGK